MATWRDARCFTDAERVALELVESVLIAKPIPRQTPGQNYTDQKGKK